ASLDFPCLDRRLHDLSADGGRLAAAARAGILEKHGHRDEWLTCVGAGVAEEPAVVRGVAVLGRAGLAPDLVAGDLGPGAGALGGPRCLPSAAAGGPRPPISADPWSS